MEGGRESDMSKVFVDEDTSRAYAEHRHSYSDQVFQIISDYCRENLPDLGLAVDVGCGPGNSTVGFTKHFKQVIGVDISETQIALAPNHIPNCQFKIGSATNLDFLQAGSVDRFACGLAINLMNKDDLAVCDVEHDDDDGDDDDDNDDDNDDNNHNVDDEDDDDNDDDDDDDDDDDNDDNNHNVDDDKMIFLEYKDVLLSSPRVFTEADRVLKPGGTLAIFGYRSPSCSNQQMDEVMQWVRPFFKPST
ncbi:hypothetical protein PoB_004178800 [Plakobranchus ocellatus]|uniref:Methyltransferase domain-containing protein n=1 Tax=Plakobranchus ocellatus TaxID=259542 RepID=A0AAV4B8Y4_9GAST|nr:hypothetical protein PoB_004178800 [Plakobranchus ocellatus]